MNRRRTLAFGALVAGVVVALAACSHVPPGNPAGTGAAGDEDPWIVRGSVGAGVTVGNPPGPYGPR
jgi:hypothetical protein